MPCAPGNFTSSAGQSTCRACPVGTYTDSPGSPACLPCDPGFYVAGAGAQACLPCPSGQYRSASMSDAGRCRPCPVGSASEAPGQTACASCAPGRFANATGQTTCTACPPGTTSSSLSLDGLGSSSCAACPAGRFAPDVAHPTCDPCPAGTAQNGTGAAACNACGPGTQQPSTGQTQCLPCPPGFYSSQARNAECVPCPLGTFASGYGATACTACPAGQFQDTRGQTSCQTCSPGRFTNVTGTIVPCTACLPGTYAGAGGAAQCAPCPPGQFQAGDAPALQCVACAPGSMAPAPGMAQCTPCPPGQYNNASGATACLDCDLGQQQPNLGALACQPCAPGTATAGRRTASCGECPAGTYSAVNGSFQCGACPGGTFAPSFGASACTACPAGSFSTNRGDDTLLLTHCTQCPKGQYGPAPNATSCLTCGPGRFQDNVGQGACLPCPVGKYVRESGQAACADCPAGTYANGTGAAECRPCPPGTFSGPTGSSACLPCAAGKFSTGHVQECTTCGGSQAAPHAGQSSCAECDRRSTANKFHSVCLCQAGLYSDERDDIGSQCQPCMRGAVCPVGTTISSMQAAPGYWKPTNVSTMFYQCLLQKNCLGGVDAACEAHHRGPLCAICDAGFYMTARGDCSQCPSRAASWAYFILIGALFAALLWAQFYIVLRAGAVKIRHVKAQDAADENERFWSDVIGVGLTQQASRQSVHASELARMRSAQAEAAAVHGQPTPKPNFSYKLKIMLGFVQIMTSLVGIIQTPLPGTFEDFVSLFAVINLDLFASAGTQCVVPSDFYDKFLFEALTPICLLVLVIVLYLIPKNVLSRETDARARKRSRKKFWRMLIFSLFLIYPSVSSTILRLYVCTEVEGVHYLRADMSITCYTTQHNAYMALGAFFIALYPVGIPVFFFVMLYRYRHRLQEDGVKAELGFLYDGYDHTFWWFEVLDMVHKLTMTGLLAFVPPTQQLGVAVCIAVSYAAVILVIRPYIRKADDRLHLFAQVEIFVACVAGYMFGSQIAMDKATDVGLSVLLIVIFAAFTALFAVQAARVIYKMVRLRRERRLRKAHLAQSKDADLGQMSDPSTDPPTFLFSQRSYGSLMQADPATVPLSSSGKSAVTGPLPVK